MVPVGDGTVMSTINPCRSPIRTARASPTCAPACSSPSRSLLASSASEPLERGASSRLRFATNPSSSSSSAAKACPRSPTMPFDRRQRARDLGFVVLEPVTGPPHGLAVQENRLPPVGHDEREAIRRGRRRGRSLRARRAARVRPAGSPARPTRPARRRRRHLPHDDHHDRGREQEHDDDRHEHPNDDGAARAERARPRRAVRGRSVGRPVRRRGGVGVADPDVRRGRFGGRPW